MASRFFHRLRALADYRTIPVAIVTGDYFLDERVCAELHRLGAAISLKPLWLEDLVALARSLVEVRH